MEEEIHPDLWICIKGAFLADFSVQGGYPLVDCPTQLTLMTWICQLCSMTNTSEKYERTQQGNLLGTLKNWSKNIIEPFLVHFKAYLGHFNLI